MNKHCDHMPDFKKKIYIGVFEKGYLCKKCGVCVRPIKRIRTIKNILYILCFILVILAVFEIPTNVHNITKPIVPRREVGIFIGILGVFVLPALRRNGGYEEVKWKKATGNYGDYEYDERSELTVEDLKGVFGYRELKGRKKVKFVRENKKHYYTIYSLKGKRLAYLEFSEMNGYPKGSVYVKGIYEYPYKGKEEEKYIKTMVLEKDLPERILKTEE